MSSIIKTTIMGDRFYELQEDLDEYFKNLDDVTFIHFCDLFVFESGTSNVKISELTEKFLRDNGLHEAYMNYIMEMRKPSQLFSRFQSDIAMIDDIKKALLVLSYNRFRKSLATKQKQPKPQTQMFDTLTRNEKRDLKMVVEHCQRHNENLMEDEDYTRNTFDNEEAEELVDERNRLAKLFPKVLKLLK